MSFDAIHVHECINSLRREKKKREKERSDYYTTRQKAESNTRTLRDTELISQSVSQSVSQEEKEKSYV